MNIYLSLVLKSLKKQDIEKQAEGLSSDKLELNKETRRLEGL